MSTSEQPRPQRVVPLVALVLSVIAVGVATWTALRPASTGPTEPTYTSAQQSDAKTAICSAADTVRRGVSLNTNLQGPGGEGDVVGSLAVAANARLSLSDGGQYLITRLDPATPTDLADAVVCQHAAGHRRRRHRGDAQQRPCPGGPVAHRRHPEQRGRRPLQVARQPSAPLPSEPLSPLAPPVPPAPPAPPRLPVVPVAA
ncbi:hypothetical protein, partial [Mycolicibacterium hodleri]|uniref:hypothetical protein n=1 Tax=Mycolicibacterium hodleri TaxID=49897 RepID=UPI0027E250FB